MVKLKCIFLKTRDPHPDQKLLNAMFRPFFMNRLYWKPILIMTPKNDDRDYIFVVLANRSTSFKLQSNSLEQGHFLFILEISIYFMIFSCWDVMNIF